MDGYSGPGHGCRALPAPIHRPGRWALDAALRVSVGFVSRLPRPLRLGPSHPVGGLHHDPRPYGPARGPGGPRTTVSGRHPCGRPPRRPRRPADARSVVPHRPALRRRHRRRVQPIADRLRCSYPPRIVPLHCPTSFIDSIHIGLVSPGQCVHRGRMAFRGGKHQCRMATFIDSIHVWPRSIMWAMDAFDLSLTQRCIRRRSHVSGRRMIGRESSGRCVQRVRNSNLSVQG